MWVVYGEPQALLAAQHSRLTTPLVASIQKQLYQDG
jgi:hypothetical protein